MVSYDGKSIGSDMALGEVVPSNDPEPGFKRILDLAAAATILVCFSPILLITSVAIKLDSRGPIFILETRHEYKNRAVQVLKFRLTTAYVEDDCTNRRLTRVGRILSRTGIDELLQFINVLRGEISFKNALHATRKGFAFI